MFQIRYLNNSVVHIKPFVDHLASDNRDSLREAHDRAYYPGVRYIVFDLQEVRWIDSSALQVLIDCYMRHRRQQTQTTLVICNLSSHVQKVVHLSGLGKLFAIAEDLDVVVRLAT